MILRPWPMILRSFPITDFSPVEGALIDASAPMMLLARAVRSGGAADELRVNMKSHDEIPLSLPAPHRNMIPTVPATKTRHHRSTAARGHEGALLHWSFAALRVTRRQLENLAARPVP